MGIGSDGHASPLGTFRSGAGLEPRFRRTAWSFSKTEGGSLGFDRGVSKRAEGEMVLAVGRMVCVLHTLQRTGSTYEYSITVYVM